MVNLYIEQLLLELPSTSGLSQAAGQRVVNEALSLLAQRLSDLPPGHLGGECQIEQLQIEELDLEFLQGPQGPAILCEALYTRLMEALQ